MATIPKGRNILRMPAVKAKTGFGHDTVYRLARAGQFPKPVKLSERASGWFEDEIDAWLESKAKARDAATAAA